METNQAALYARVSGEQQVTEQTIASQLEALRERMLTDACPAQPELEFIDDGWTGATLIRPALERLRDAVAFGGIERLYVHSPDRLARKYAYQVILIDELRRAGVDVIFLNRAIGRSPEDDLLLQVEGMISEYERTKILERSRRGKRHKAQNGQVSVLSAAPYGYRYVNVHEGAGCARYDVMPEEAQVVRQIFESIGRERATISQVCRQLATQRIPSPRGKPIWDRTTVCRILKNPAYCGEAAFGKTHTDAPRPRVRLQRRQRLPAQSSIIATPREKWLNIPVPPLVEADLFAAVQGQLQENRERARTQSRGVRYLLQGLAVCKQCGYAYCARPVSNAAAKGHRRDYVYYRCLGSEAYRFGGQRVCANTPVRSDCLEQAVWQEVCALLNDPHRLAQEYERRLAVLTEPANDVTRSNLEKQLRQCVKGIARVVDAYTDSYLDKPDFESRIGRLTERRHTLEKQLEQLDNEAMSHAELQLVVGRLEDFARKVKAGLETTDFLEQRELIRTLVKKVEIDQEQVNIVFRVEPTRDAPDSGQSLPHCGGRVYSGTAGCNDSPDD